MVTRKECKKHYAVLGIPTKDTTLDTLFIRVERKYQAEKGECNINTKGAYEALKKNDLSFYTSSGKSSTEVFDLEEGETEYIDDIYTDLLKDCDRHYKVGAANTRSAKDFLKDYHTTCTTNSACADSYQVLGMLEGGSISDVNKVYRKISKKYHPDLCQGQVNTICKVKQDEFNVEEAFNLEQTFNLEFCIRESIDICKGASRAKQGALQSAKKYLVDEKNKCTEISNLQDFFLVEEAGALPRISQDDL